MHEGEWDKCDDPDLMLEFLGSEPSDRKQVLFAVACCRQVWHLMTDDRSRKAVEVAEWYADGLASEDDWKTVSRTAEAVIVEAQTTTAMDAADAAAGIAVDLEDASNAAAWALVVEVIAEATAPMTRTAAHSVARKRQTPLLRDIFGNPFRPVTLDASWLTSDVVALARGIYEERAFSAMPILADALQDAGCANEDVLNHCRDPKQVHVRGCWVLDLLLGKE